MVRICACLTLLLAARVAAAEMAVEDPPVFRCREQPSWDAVVACLRRIGTPEVSGEARGARLVHVVRTAGGSHLDYGVFLFVNRGRQWVLGGMYNGPDEVTGFEWFDSSGVHGYRIDLAHAAPMTLHADDGRVVTAVQATRQEVLCDDGPARLYCMPFLTACDLYIEGRSRATFRGKLVVSGKLARLVGDRTKAGTCTPPITGEVAWHD